METNKNIQAEVNETNERENVNSLDAIKAKASNFWAKNKKTILIGAGTLAAAAIVYAIYKAGSNGVGDIDQLDVRPRNDFDDGEMRRMLWEERGLEAKYQKACKLIKNVGKELDLAPDERFWFTGILQGDNYSVKGTEEAGVGGWFEIDGSDISRPRDLA